MSPELLPAMSPTEALSALRTGAVLIDVREYDEWMAGRVTGAVHLPMSEIQRRLDEVPLDRQVICVCRSGNRSGQVATWLRQQGIDAVNLTGGMRAWSAEGLPFANHAGNPGVVI